MNRKQVEHRIHTIVDFIGNQELLETLTKTLPLFSESELQQLLGFLESGDEKIIYQLLKEKIDEYKAVIDKIKILKGKLKIEKIWAKEQAERDKEQSELYSLFL